MSQQNYADRIRDQIKVVEQRIATLNAELADLRAAQRVIRQLEENSSENHTKGKKRAFFMPPEMAQAIRDNTISSAVIAKLRAHGPMDSGAILDELQKTWRHDLNSSTLLSTLSRMKAAGRIINKDRQWMLPQTEEALSSSQLDNASKPDVAESHTPNNVND
jgi:hypothetical protein